LKRRRIWDAKFTPMGEFELQEQPHGIQWLLDEANERGYLTYDQILEAFPEAEDDAASLTTRLEELLAYLCDHGIAVYDARMRRWPRMRSRAKLEARALTAIWC